MNVYFDSGALVKLYIKETYSDVVVALVANILQIPISPIHELEIRNALRAQYGRHAISQEELGKALAAFDSDIISKRLFRFVPDWLLVYDKSEELSNKYTPKLLCRALDILHVSTALSLKCSQFVTGDARQAKLAGRAGLKVNNIAI